VAVFAHPTDAEVGHGLATPRACGLRFHDLRQTVITELAEMGVAARCALGRHTDRGAVSLEEITTRTRPSKRLASAGVWL
jgi:hypothetical protein